MAETEAVPKIDEGLGEFAKIGEVAAGEPDSEEPKQRKSGRAEKKMKETLLRHNLQKLEGVNSVMMRKGAQLVWSFTQPEVYRLDNVYVIFGEPSASDPGVQAVQQLKSSAATDASPAEPAATVVEDAGEADATGLREEDINTIIQQTSVTRARAIEALRQADGDLVTAVMNLAL
jgi:nascent polypeptide-associated complex subunit alpha